MSEQILDSIFYKIKELLESNQCFIEEPYRSISYGIQFTVSDGAVTGVLRLYMNSKKKLRIDYSQLKIATLSNKVESIINNSMESIYSSYSSNSKTNIVNDPNSEYNLGYPIIGSDESGKGDFFGSLVVASVFVNESSANLLAKNGVQDSKNLTDKKILKLEEVIKNYCWGKFSIIEIKPEKYNHLYENFKKQGKNLNMLLAWAHAKALEDLLSRVECKKAIIDKFANESLILRSLQENGKKLEIIQKHKAENNIAVAAASILARAQFIKRLTIFEEQYNQNFYKGASTQVITSAKQFVDSYGKNSLKEVAKLHFKTTEKI